MARAKKQEKPLSLEQKLDQILILDQHKPFSIPQNWQWVKLGGLGYTNIGLTYKPKDKSEIGTIVLRSCNIKNGTMDYSDIVRVNMDIPENKMCKSGDILICARNGSKALVGKTAIIDRDGMSYGAFMAIFRSPYNRLIYHYLNSHYFRDLIDKDVGTTTINQVTQQLIKDLPFPLPPLKEQQRIVDRIESLFAKLDEAKEKAQAVVDGFEDRKAAILHKAFTGELTAGWRKNKGFTEKGWQKKTIGEFSFVTKLAGFEYTNNIAPNLVETGIPLFKGKNVQQGKLVLEFESFIPKEVSDELSRSKITKKCLLTPYVGTIGNIAIFDGSFEAHLGSNVGKIEIESETFEEYLLYYLRSDLGYRELTKEKKATAQESISIKAIRNVVVLLPKMDEQLEIVSVLDCLINKEQQAKEVAEQVISQIDTMKKSILARAFRGELGTNDPADESAVEMLKRIL